MGDLNSSQDGLATTAAWNAHCKDCRAEARAAHQSKKSSDHIDSQFTYSDNWATRTLERGGTRSDRCERHRRAHREAIRAIAVAYIDLETIGEAAGRNSRNGPTGPLGGLGPLPVEHRPIDHTSDLKRFEMGLTDNDIVVLLDAIAPKPGGATKQVAVVEAGTGTGKSTLMPFRLMNPPDGATFRLSAAGPIVVTQPRKGAATGIARFVGEEMVFGEGHEHCSDHIGPGFPVGYRVSGDQRYDFDCELIYVTDGSLINWIREGQLAKIGAIIVDEAHERSENIDIILAELRALLPRYPHLRLIVTSATMDKDFFVEYFGGEECVHYQPIEAPKSFGYGVPLFIGLDISDDVIENGLSSGDITFPGWAPKPRPTEEDTNAEDLRDKTRLLRDLRLEDPINDPTRWKAKMPEAVAEQAIKLAKHAPEGDILAFLPTRATITEAIDRIKRGVAREKLKNTFVYELLASTSKEEQEKAVAPSRPGKRKIVVSSNLAETSLTVKGIRYVIESGLICQERWDPELAKGRMETGPHSRSGVRQRWGRVGRDTPGWVFPLYTIEQFLRLPKDTPPSSTQTNLETFCMKLISAGLDPDSAVLPADFTHDNVATDRAGEAAIETFTQERQRALTALRSSGAVDRDGHLTDYGRELERFSGSGAEAVAIMLADQLACLHEVGVALAILHNGNLHGAARHGGLLRIEKTWPAAWRVQAARCHHTLAAGCADDLDLALRIVAEWQALPKDRRSDWCDEWWINEQALVDSIAATEEHIANLSGGMKKEAARNIDPRLADRARAVISRAMASFEYQHQRDDVYRSTANGEADTVQLARSTLTEPGRRLIALGGYRRASSDNEDRGVGMIQHAVRVVEWALTLDSDPQVMGIDLALAAARHLPRAVDLPEWIGRSDAVFRRHVPPGAILEGSLVEIDGELWLSSWDVATRGFKYPGEPVDADQDDEEATFSGPGAEARLRQQTGFDRDWDPSARADPEMPEEEQALEVLDPRSFETNDLEEIDDEALTEGEVPTAAMPNLLVVSSPPNTALPVNTPVRLHIRSYRPVDENTVELTVRPVDWSNQGMPDEHADLDCGDPVDVVVVGVEPVHGGGFLELERTDGRGTFFVPENCGASYTDWTFGGRLRPSATLEAIALPADSSTERITVSILPTVKDHIEAAPGVKQQRLFRQQQPFYPATVTGEGAERDRLILQLDHSDPDRGIVHQFEIPLRKVDDRVRNERGTKVIVAIGPDRSGRRLTLPADPDVAEVAARHSDYLAIKDGEIIPTYAHPPLGVIRDLIGARDDAAWERNVWRFYLDHHHLEAKEVWVDLPVSGRLTVPPGKNRYIARNLRSWREQTGCRANNPDDGQLWTIEGPDEPSVRQFIELASAEAWGTTGEVLTPAGAPPSPKPAETTDKTTPVDASLEAILAELKERGVGRQTEGKASSSGRREPVRKKASSYIRVHELATKLGTDTGTVLAACEDLGYAITHAVSGLTKDQAAAIETRLSQPVSEADEGARPTVVKPAGQVKAPPVTRTPIRKDVTPARPSKDYHRQRRRLNMATVWLLVGSGIAAPFWYLLLTGDLGAVARSINAGSRFPALSTHAQAILAVASPAGLALLTFQRSTRWNYRKVAPGRGFPIAWLLIALMAVSTLELLGNYVVPYRERWVAPYSTQWIAFLLAGPVLAGIGLILALSYPIQLRRVRARFGLGKRPLGRVAMPLLMLVIAGTYGVTSYTPAAVRWAESMLDSSATSTSEPTSAFGSPSMENLEGRRLDELRPTDRETLTLETIAPGTSGDNVRMFQQLLTDRGYELGRADGVYGGRTEAAVRDFQIDAQLPDNGALDPTTQATLSLPVSPTRRSLLCSSQVGSPLDPSGQLVTRADLDGDERAETLEVRATSDGYVEMSVATLSDTQREVIEGGGLKLPADSSSLLGAIEAVDIDGDGLLEGVLCASASDRSGQRSVSVVVFAVVNAEWKPILVRPWVESGVASLLGPRVVVEACNAGCWSTTADSYVLSDQELIDLGRLETDNVRAFLARLDEAFGSSDWDQLVSALHPLVLREYGAEQCRSYVQHQNALPTNPMRVRQAPTLWKWGADDLDTWVGRVMTVNVAGGGPSGTRHLGLIGSELRWFADCGEPLTP
jgi:HrpA-like RNA helicase